MIFPIITEGNPILRQRSGMVADISLPNVQKLIDDMISTMYTKDGIGLAAPQIAQSLQIAVIVPDPENFEKYREAASDALVLINPTIVKHSLFSSKGEEGCLSVPDIFGVVRRWNSVEVSYQERTGTAQKIKASGLMARVLQHEIDHLNGILFIDKAEQLYKIHAL